MIEQKFIWRGVAVVVALLLLFSFSNSVAVRTKGALRNVVSPLQGLLLTTGSSLKAGADSVRGFGGLAEENQRLRKVVSTLQVEQRLNEHLGVENRRLREMLDFKQQQSIELISAQVVSRSVSGWWQSIGLDRGTRSGIHSRQAVISPDGLVGRTSDVSMFSSQVVLVSDPACKISARVGRTGSFGLVRGRGINLKGYPLAEMEFIHKDTPIRVGDDVITSGLGGVFPKDILIGRIESIRKDEAGLYQIAEILPQGVVSLTDVVFVTAEHARGTE